MVLKVVLNNTSYTDNARVHIEPLENATLEAHVSSPEFFTPVSNFSTCLAPAEKPPEGLSCVGATNSLTVIISSAMSYTSWLVKINDTPNPERYVGWYGVLDYLNANGFTARFLADEMTLALTNNLATQARLEIIANDPNMPELLFTNILGNPTGAKVATGFQACFTPKPVLLPPDRPPYDGYCYIFNRAYFSSGIYVAIVDLSPSYPGDPAQLNERDGEIFKNSLSGVGMNNTPLNITSWFYSNTSYNAVALDLRSIPYDISQTFYLCSAKSFSLVPYENMVATP